MAIWKHKGIVRIRTRVTPDRIYPIDVFDVFDNVLERMLVELSDVRLAI